MKDTTKPAFYFADTYALIEILGMQNKNYKPYIDSVLFTTLYNIMELYYHFLRTYGQETADKYLHIYDDILIPISHTSIQEGMELKLKHKKERLSYIDCVGYALAKENNIKFLTGDEKFEDKENVEFVK
jgi:uncharacterized protein